MVGASGFWASGVGTSGVGSTLGLAVVGGRDGAPPAARFIAPTMASPLSRARTTPSTAHRNGLL